MPKKNKIIIFLVLVVSSISLWARIHEVLMNLALEAPYLPTQPQPILEIIGFSYFAFWGILKTQKAIDFLLSIMIFLINLILQTLIMRHFLNISYKKLFSKMFIVALVDSCVVAFLLWLDLLFHTIALAMLSSWLYFCINVFVVSAIVLIRTAIASKVFVSLDSSWSIKKIFKSMLISQIFNVLFFMLITIIKNWHWWIRTLKFAS